MKIKLMITNNGIEKLYAFYESIEMARNAGLYLVRKNRATSYKMVKG